MVVIKWGSLEVGHRGLQHGFRKGTAHDGAAESLHELQCTEGLGSFFYELGDKILREIERGRETITEKMKA